MAPIWLQTWWPAPPAREEDGMGILLDGIAIDDPLRAVIEQKLTAAIGRGRIRPTSVRVVFADENGPKGGVDTRCAVTVEIPRRPGVHASAIAESARLAFDGALEAMGRELVRDRQRRRDMARRPKKYFVAQQALRPDGEAALPPIRRRRRSA
jgi:ribosome-associated translation inhibitor RaiA